MSTIAGLKRALDLHSRPLPSEKLVLGERHTSLDDNNYVLSPSIPSGSQRYTSPNSLISSVSSATSYGDNLVTDSASPSPAADLYDNDSHSLLSLIDEENSSIDGEYLSTSLSRQASPTQSSGSRASRRARKPTSKAQALAGTKLFRSLDKKSPTMQIPAGRNEEKSKAPSTEAAYSNDSFSTPVDVRATIEDGKSSERASDSPQPTIISHSHGARQEYLSDDTEIEDSTRRLSKRARRAPVRLRDELDHGDDDSENLRTSSTEKPKRSVQISLARPSKLRFSLNAGEGHSGENEMVIAATTSRNQSPQLKRSEFVTSFPITLKLSPAKLAEVSSIPRSYKNDDQKEANPDDKTSSCSTTSQPIHACDLSCLTPSDRLLVFAQVAAEMPEPENDNISEPVDISDFEDRLAKSVAMFCQCRLSEQRSIASQET